MFENNENIRPLTADEMTNIEGGKTFFYYFFYGAAYLAHTYTDNWAEMTSGMGTNMRR